jgi:CTP:molybdopterin cytidylyltransferase MocA
MKSKIFDDFYVEFSKGKKVYVKNGEPIYEEAVRNIRTPFSFLILSSRMFDLGHTRAIVSSIEALSLDYEADIVFVVGKKEYISLLEQAFSDKFYKSILSENPESPVYSSIKLGLKCISPYSEGAVIIYGNRDVIATQDLKKILDTILSGVLITIPVRNGKRAHPVAFNKELFPQLSDLRKEKGIPYILRKYSTQIRTVEIG